MYFHNIQKISRFQKKAVRTLGSIFVASLLCAFLPSCINETFSSDEPDSPSKTDGANYYISLNVTVPGEASTRSYTTEDGASNDNTLSGAANEVLLVSAELYFCVTDENGEEEVKLKLETEQWKDITDKSDSEKKYALVARLKSLGDLKELAGKDVKLYIVGNSLLDHNMGDETGEKNAAGATFSIEGVTQRPIGDFGTDGRGKLMPLVNAASFPIKELKKIETDGKEDEEVLEAIKGLFNFVSTVNGEPNTYNLGELDMERAVARVDFGDLTRSDTPDAANPDENLDAWTYSIASTENILLKLHSLQVFNVNPESYLFKHTAKGSISNASGAIELFGTERGSSGYTWVAGSDWKRSTGENEEALLTKASSTTYHNPLKYEITDESCVISGVEGSAGEISISDLTAVKNNRDYIDPESKRTYYAWCYLSENTLPATSYFSGASLLKHATGIAFKFKVLDNAGIPVTPESGHLPQNVEFISDENDKDVDGNQNSYPDIKITDSKGYWITVPYTEGSDDDDSGYFITYYNYVVHNDSYTDSTAPEVPMYYGVVRNTVYQLSVKSIGELPDPNKPESYYLSLRIKVLAWAKRDIEVAF